MDIGGARFQPCLAAAVVVAVLAVACEQPVPDPVDVVRPVKMLELAAGQSEQPLEYPGRIAATRQVEIAFEVGGLITELPVTQGELVQRGQLLARLDPRDFAAALDAQRAEVNVALADYRRYQDLYAADAASLQELEVSRRRFEVADAQIRTVEKAVEDTELLAPFSGRVARTLVDAFQGVGARQPILVLQDVTETLDVIVNVPENDVTFRAGETARDVREIPVEVGLTSYPSRRIPVRPKEIATEADPITRTFEITFSFDLPDDLTVLPGMTATIYAAVDRSVGQFSIPASALASDERGDPFVWIVDRAGMTVSPRSVTIGELSGDEVEIVDGLQGTETVVISAAQNLRDGMAVREIAY
ncbi:MAG: efflux RND transporter periplasmic adaptor subunit [Vicinamibacterales bacterium]